MSEEVESAVLRLLFVRGQKTFGQTLSGVNWAGIYVDKETLLETLIGLWEKGSIDMVTEMDSLTYQITAAGAKKYETAARGLQTPSQGPAI